MNIGEPIRVIENEPAPVRIEPVLIPVREEPVAIPMEPFPIKVLVRARGVKCLEDTELGLLYMMM